MAASPRPFQAIIGNEHFLVTQALLGLLLVHKRGDATRRPLATQSHIRPHPIKRNPIQSGGSPPVQIYALFSEHRRPPVRRATARHTRIQLAWCFFPGQIPSAAKRMNSFRAVLQNATSAANHPTVLIGAAALLSQCSEPIRGGPASLPSGVGTSLPAPNPGPRPLKVTMVGTPHEDRLGASRAQGTFIRSCLMVPVNTDRESTCFGVHCSRMRRAAILTYRA